jgi:hypothetical protein
LHLDGGDTKTPVSAADTGVSTSSISPVLNVVFRGDARHSIECGE